MSASKRALSLYGNPELVKNTKRIKKFIFVSGEGVLFPNITFHAQDVAGQHFLADSTLISRELNEWPTSIESWNIRKIRGSLAWSLHSWGVAFDVFGQGQADPKTSRRLMSVEWTSRMKDRGWVAGADFRVSDPHHFEIKL